MVTGYRYRRGKRIEEKISVEDQIKKAYVKGDIIEWKEYGYFLELSIIKQNLGIPIKVTISPEINLPNDTMDYKELRALLYNVENIPKRFELIKTYILNLLDEINDPKYIEQSENKKNNQIEDILKKETCNMTMSEILDVRREYVDNDLTIEKFLLDYPIGKFKASMIIAIGNSISKTVSEIENSQM